MNILFEDNHLLVVNKPAGLLTQPNDTSDPSLEVQARAFVKQRDNKPGNVFAEPIHRIDRPVSGVVVFAKTSKALSRLHAAVRERRVEKLYWALLDGDLPSVEGELHDNLVHDDHRARVVTSGGKPARLAYRRLDDHLYEMELFTGRYHQIRVQLANAGAPIRGDEKYGSRVRHKGEGIGLHHRQMVVPHPISGEMMAFTAPCPWLS